jgi:7-cyano-7-deazaguanine synthase
MKATVVPNRNMMLLSIAASYSISLATQLGRHGAFIAYAAHAGDHTIYPDCRPIFVIAMRTALNAASEDPAIELIAPFIRMTKAELLAYGLGLRPDLYKHTYSCYNGGEEACGLCGTCVERLEAFALNDTKDPITYAQQGTEAL